MRRGNLLTSLVPAQDKEQIDKLTAGHGRVRVERIVSTGQASPPDFWYDQPHGEWVVVLQGEARLLLEGESGLRVLRRGDFPSEPEYFCTCLKSDRGT